MLTTSINKLATSGTAMTKLIKVYKPNNIIADYLLNS